MLRRLLQREGGGALFLGRWVAEASPFLVHGLGEKVSKARTAGGSLFPGARWFVHLATQNNVCYLV